MDSKKDVNERLTAYLRELHLPTIRECFEELARRATQETASYEQYLLELAERECQVRWAKRTERLLRQSRLPSEKDLASFDLGRLPTKVTQQVRTLLDGSFVDRATFLRQIASPCAVSSLREEDVRINVLGDVAIIYARTTYGKPDGKPGAGRYTDVWQLRQGRWLCVSANVSRG